MTTTDLGLRAVDSSNLIHPEFTLSSPLGPWNPQESKDGFLESEDAHAHYVGHRSNDAAPNTKILKLTDNCSGEEAGFVAFRLQEEDGHASRRIFVSIEYIYVMKKFRRQRVGASLLMLVLREVESMLISRPSTVLRPKTYLFSASHPETNVEARVLRTFEESLKELAKRRPGVTLIGFSQEHPAGACQRLHTAHMSKSRH
jgi:GNAT superfamily N-acetyltransferase